MKADLDTETFTKGHFLFMQQAKKEKSLNCRLPFPTYNLKEGLIIT